MGFEEMVLTLVQRPGYVALLAPKRVVKLNKAGYLLDATKSEVRYINLNTNDILAVTWEVWTPKQLEDMARAEGGG